MKSFADRFGCESSHTDYHEMLERTNLDGVILATWPTDHHEQILACLSAGVLNILCEKSITADSAAVFEVWKAARAANALVVEGFAYRHHPTMKILDELLSTGAIGEIDNIAAGFENFDPENESLGNPKRNWRSRKELRGGVPFDTLCYCVNAATHIANALPLSVMAVAKESPRYGTVHRLYGLIEYENGVVATLSTSKRSAFNYELKVSGASGNIVVPSMWSPNRLPPRENVEPGDVTEIYLRRRLDLFAWESNPIVVPAADPFLLQLENFAAAMRGLTVPVVPLADSVCNVYAIEALLASAEKKTAVSVDLPNEVRAELLEVFAGRVSQVH
jgi:predicted dehydrogenase